MSRFRRLLSSIALAALLPSLAIAATPVVITDTSGNAVGVTGNALNVNATVTGSTPIVPSVASAAAESCHVYKNAPGTVYSLSGYAGTAPVWIMVFNLTAAPSDGAVTPISWNYLSAIGAWSISYSQPASFITGVVACASSTGPLIKTAIGTNTVFAGQVQ